MLGSESALTIVLLLPLLGTVILFLIPERSRSALLATALGISGLDFLLSLQLWWDFDSELAGMQFLYRTNWFEAAGLKVEYHVGVDGISLFLVLLTTFLMPLVILGSWSVGRQLRGYLIFMLLLQVGMIGVFISLDLILFYLFWEVMLIPMYFLIGVWGGERRIYAAVKFFIYTMAGSALMLAAIIALFFFNGSHGFDLLQITRSLQRGDIDLSPLAQQLLFLAFFLAFAIKVPLFPFHTWLPDAHVEAPTGGSVVLAGVLLKMGTYGLLRFCLPLFPLAAIDFAPFISFLAIVGIIYGALVAMVQPDVKKLVAYSSVSHLGFVVLGIFAFNVTAIEGATLQMLNHGISTGALFLLVGMIYDRRHTRQISHFGGLAHVMPRYAVLFMIVTLSSIGLPGLNGFVGEFLILQGTFLTSPWRAAFAATAMILSAVYMLWMYQRVFLGAITQEENRSLRDLNRREIGLLLPLVALAIWIGMGSGAFLRPMDKAVEGVVQRIEDARDSQVIRVENSGR